MAKSSKPGLAERSADRVYDVVRAGILEGTFKAGDHLGEAQLAELSDSSRTPVREALRRLAADGLVTIGENRRCLVSEFDATEIQAIYEIRARLESLGAELACSRIDDVGVDHLREINARIEALGPEVSDYTLTQFLELNSEFHLAIVRISGSRHLESALSTALAVPIVLLKHYVWGDKVGIELSHLQHREIIAALSSGNPHWASACVASHIQTSRPRSIMR